MKTFLKNNKKRLFFQKERVFCRKHQKRGRIACDSTPSKFCLLNSAFLKNHQFNIFLKSYCSGSGRYCLAAS